MDGLGSDALTQLLPESMENAKKVRLFITIRDKDAMRMTMCKGVKKELYAIEILPEEEALKLSKRYLDENENKLIPRSSRSW